jgi:hypothetical protein
MSVPSLAENARMSAPTRVNTQVIQVVVHFLRLLHCTPHGEYQHPLSPGRPAPRHPAHIERVARIILRPLQPDDILPLGLGILLTLVDTPFLHRDLRSFTTPLLPVLLVLPTLSCVVPDQARRRLVRFCSRLSGLVTGHGCWRGRRGRHDKKSWGAGKGENRSERQNVSASRIRHVGCCGCCGPRIPRIACNMLLFLAATELTQTRVVSIC